MVRTLRCAIAHRGISRFSDAQLRIVVRCLASPRNDKGPSAARGPAVFSECPQRLPMTWWPDFAQDVIRQVRGILLGNASRALQRDTGGLNVDASRVGLADCRGGKGR